MTLRRRAWTAFRSLLAVLLAFAAVFAVNLLGSWLAAWLVLPAGGSPRLAWDLLWVVLSGIAGAWVAVRSAPCTPRGHALAFLLLMLAMDTAAVVRMGADFPLWFSAGLLLTLPLQVWLGMRLALGRSR
ncbi:hypothetical protein [Pseudoxanthomonas suwonensis]|uniref:Transmembrane protein n=1 Tax=Pseudoxanthomonas suwonensis TaxID=314722 RepID=A0A0E3Z224_9GAMM|nr:hypothetical protein [Pseudoxanthomonas suwonensis]AKC87103.1 hypothetical protein WQ53_10455 [Pseudoxanthomonas suwonensis]